MVLFKKILILKYILLTILIASIGVLPLLHSGFPPTHDGEYHVIRFYEFDKAFRDGDWYPRWAPNLNNEYGVPLFNFVYPFPNYAALVFHAFGFSFIDGFKLSLFFATIIGAVFFYLWSRCFWGELGGLVAAVFYSFSPYRFVDIYIRGSVGEVWALAWFPAFLWSVTLLIDTKKPKYIVLSAIFFALTIFSHNILAVMFCLFSFTYILFLLGRKKWDKDLFLYTGLSIFFGLLISTIFWLPALTETKYVQGLQIYNVDRSFPELYQLLIPSWGTAPFGSLVDSPMSVQVGVANLLVVLAVIFRIRSRMTVFFLTWFFITFFLILYISKPLWHILPFFDYFQFPWRFLSLMILICSFLAGAVVAGIHNKKLKRVGAVMLMILAILLSIGYTKPAYYHDRKDEHYIRRDNFIHGTNSPGGNTFNTKWMGNVPKITKNKLVIDGKATIDTQEMKTSRYNFSVTVKQPVTAAANIAYFPGWTVLVDNKEVSTKITKQGLFSFSVPKGAHIVQIRFNDTIVRKVAEFISGLGIVLNIIILSLRGVLDEAISYKKEVLVQRLPRRSKTRSSQ